LAAQIILLGYDVITANDGEAAYDLYIKNPEVSILITDVVMPRGISGSELADKILLHNPEVKVILTTGYSRGALENAGQTGSHLNTLAKPYSLSELKSAINAALF